MKFILLFLVLLLGNMIFAQDIIIKISEDEVKVLEIILDSILVLKPSKGLV